MSSRFFSQQAHFLLLNLFLIIIIIIIRTTNGFSIQGLVSSGRGQGSGEGRARRGSLIFFTEEQSTTSFSSSSSSSTSLWSTSLKSSHDDAVIASSTSSSSSSTQTDSMSSPTSKDGHDHDDDGKEKIEKPPCSTSCFTTDPYSLFLEDTDAYGVMFNANYLKYYQRALQSHYFQQQQQQKKEDFLLTKVTKHKFKSSLTLMNQFVIQGEKIHVKLDGIDDDDGTKEEVWDIKMIIHNDDDNDNDLVCNSAIITVSKYCNRTQQKQQQVKEDNSSKEQNQQQVEERSQTTTNDDSRIVQSSKSSPYKTKVSSIPFQTFNDEFVSIQNNNNDIQLYLPFHNILNYFERVRTIALGGPALLKRIQDDGYILVVTSIDDLELLPMNMNTSASASASTDTTPTGTSSIYNNDDIIANHGNLMNENVIVESQMIIKRGGMIFECRQELLGRVDNTLCPIARGVVTIYAIDVKNGYRPTKNLPDYAKQLFL